MLSRPRKQYNHDRGQFDHDHRKGPWKPTSAQIVFSVIQRKVVKPADFVDLDDLGRQLTAFKPHYNATARPFDWRFTRVDLG